jgi:hypothetical protein
MQKIKWSLAVWVSVVVVAGVACSPENLNGDLASRIPAETATGMIGTARGSAEPEATPESEQPADILEGTQSTPTANERSVLERTSPDPSQLPERVPHQEEVMVTGEVPGAILDPIIEDVVAHTGADREDIEILRTESVAWRDGSLGCPEPGMMYTQALVNGYWVVLRYGAQEYDYRVSSSGYFVLCDQPPSNRIPPLDGEGGGAPNQ